MPVPTGPLTLGNIQTEFGGAAPTSMSEYYRGGVYVPSGTATSATDGTPISTSGAIRVGMFRGTNKTVVITVGSVVASYANYASAGFSTTVYGYSAESGGWLLTSGVDVSDLFYQTQTFNGNPTANNNKTFLTFTSAIAATSVLVVLGANSATFTGSGSSFSVSGNPLFFNVAQDQGYPVTITAA